MVKSALATALGVLLLVAAALLAARTRAFVGSASAVSGVVAGLNAGGSHPQIEFTTPAGARVSYPQGGLIFGYRPGQPVRVLFDPRNPAGTARIDAIGALWFDTIGLSFVGVIFLIVGVSGLVKRRSVRT
ncbi:MAG TPA: DUF3592 domain-containing protein [Polyangia bacterium]